MTLPATFATARDGDLLSLQQRIGEAEENLARPVAAHLATERAGDHQILAREGGDTSRDRPLALLAGDHVVGRLDGSLRTVMHAHGGIVGDQKANIRMCTTHGANQRKTTRSGIPLSDDEAEAMLDELAQAGVWPRLAGYAPPEPNRGRRTGRKPTLEELDRM